MGNVSMDLQIENDASMRLFEEKQNMLAMYNSASYAGSDAQSWLLSIAQSLVTSLLLWQPLMIYIVTWLKLWMFTWNLKMSVGPKNIFQLLMRCCCTCGGDEGDEDDIDEEEMKEKSARNRRLSSVTSHGDRPLDIIGFLPHDAFVIDDTQDEPECQIDMTGIEIALENFELR